MSYSRTDSDDVQPLRVVGTENESEGEIEYEIEKRKKKHEGEEMPVDSDSAYD